MALNVEEIWRDPAFIALEAKAFSQYFLREKRIAHLPLSLPLASHVDAARKVCSGNFEIAGEVHQLDLSSPNWLENPSRDKEWQIAFHKHYFALDLIQAYRSTRQEQFLSCWIGLMESWIAETHPGSLATSDAHVDAKRVEHWITAYLLLRDAETASAVPGDFLRRYLERMAQDAVYVSRNLRAARNHRTFQLYSMFMTGVVFPEFCASAELTADGKQLLVENLLNDFTAQGVHIERSTHYHNITLETALSFVSLARANSIELPVILFERLRTALKFSAFVQFPDGEIPLLNDSDNGDHSEMLAVGARLFEDPFLEWAATRGERGKPAEDRSAEFDGYFILSDGWGHDPQSFAGRQHVVFDCAPLGEGSHSHYDLFNMCWFASGQQIIIDPGRYTYDPEPGERDLDWRREFKSTRYHNTVEIDGCDQTRYLSKAKKVHAGVERLDRTRSTQKHGPAIELVSSIHRLGADTDWIRGTARSHEYSPLHSRTIVFVCGQYIVLIDDVAITDGCEHSAALRFHFSQSAGSGISLSRCGPQFSLMGNGFSMRVVAPDGSTGEISKGWVSKAYGIKYPAPVLEITCRSSRSISFHSVLAASMVGQESLEFRSVTSDATGTMFVECAIGGSIFFDEISGLEGRDCIDVKRRDRHGNLVDAGQNWAV